MARSSNRRQLDIPIALYEALDQVAQRQDMPTSAMAALWLWEALEAKGRIPGHPAEGIHAPQPYRGDGPQMYPRRNKGEATMRNMTVQPSKTHTSVTDAARITGRTPAEILAAIETGELAALPMLDEWVIDRQDLATWSETHSTPR